MKTVTLKPLECTIRVLSENDREAAWMLPKRDVNFRPRIEAQKAGRLEYIAAFASERAVGSVVLQFVDKEAVHAVTDGAPCPELVDLHVIQAFRNVGIATNLIAFVEERARSAGYDWLGLAVNPTDSTIALALYERLGFVRHGDVYHGGTYEIDNDDGSVALYEDWVFDMVKSIR